MSSHTKFREAVAKVKALARSQGRPVSRAQRSQVFKSVFSKHTSQKTAKQVKPMARRRYASAARSYGRRAKSYARGKGGANLLGAAGYGLIGKQLANSLGNAIPVSIDARIKRGLVAYAASRWMGGGVVGNIAKAGVIVEVASLAEGGLGSLGGLLGVSSSTPSTNTSNAVASF